LLEKPLVSQQSELDILTEIIEQNNTKIYCIDWEIEHSKPLLSVLLNNIDIQVPFEDLVKKDDPDDHFKGFLISDIVSIDARFVEASNNALCAPDKMNTRRPWLFDYSRGGGLLYDMAIHPLNVLSVIGFKAGDIDEVKLAVTTENQGVYRLFNDQDIEAKVGEAYGRIKFSLTHSSSNKKIPTTVEAAKYAKHDDGVIRLVNKNGQTLEWNMFPKGKPGSTLELFDKNDNKLACAEMKFDAYSLVIEHATQLFEESNLPMSIYFKEQREMLQLLFKAQSIGRLAPNTTKKKIKQLKLEEKEA
jgi:predicted dehydrogenase